jgi:hypothetical protein
MCNGQKWNKFRVLYIVVLLMLLVKFLYYLTSVNIFNVKLMYNN